MSKFELKEKVFDLRRNGVSLNEIAQKVCISKSTVSSWCREIVLTDTQRKYLTTKMIKAGHRGRLLGAAANRQKKEASIVSAQKWAEELFGSMSDRDFLLAGIALYWAEGSKAGKSQLTLVNSDPTMIVFMYKWFQRFFGIKTVDFILRVYINEIHRPRINKVLNFWSHLLELPRSSFRKTTFIKTKQRKVYSNHDNYHGLLALRLRNSSLIKYKTLALIDLVRNAGVAQLVRASHS